jgi:methionyl-tRNA formyltransferase
LCRVVGVVESEVLLPRMAYHRALRKYFDNAGVEFFMAQGLKKAFFQACLASGALLGITDPGNIFYYYRRILASRGIPVHRTRDINSPESLAFLGSTEPDLVIIVLFAQILKAEALDIPRLGSLNFHPSLLPKYRGLMPVFWALADGESHTGATIHWVDTGIDTGQIVDQEAIEITERDTEHSLYARICIVAAGMLTNAVRELAGGASLPRRNREDVTQSYRSVPTREAMRGFKRRGRRLFRPSELLRPFEWFEVLP